MPSPTVAKNIEMEDIKFHQCVRLSKFENEKLITFIPPDGEFTLMSYRLSSSQFLMKPLILVNCKTKVHKHSRIEILCTAKAQIKKSTANNVEVIIPIPEDADTLNFRQVRFCEMDSGKVVPYMEVENVPWWQTVLDESRVGLTSSHRP